LLNYMEKRGYATCTPRNTDPSIERLPPVDFSSGYFQRAMDKLPRQGSRKPWRIYQNYVRDLVALRLAPLDDGVLQFTARPHRPDPEPGEEAGGGLAGGPGGPPTPPPAKPPPPPFTIRPTPPPRPRLSL